MSRRSTYEVPSYTKLKMVSDGDLIKLGAERSVYLLERLMQLSFDAFIAHAIVLGRQVEVLPSNTGAPNRFADVLLVRVERRIVWKGCKR